LKAEHRVHELIQLILNALFSGNEIKTSLALEVGLKYISFFVSKAFSSCPLYLKPLFIPAPTSQELS
jgi:hypothetical protein